MAPISWQHYVIATIDCDSMYEVSLTLLQPKSEVLPRAPNISTS